MFDAEIRMLQKVCFHVGTRNLVRGRVTAFKKAANTPRWPSAHDIRIALDSAPQRARHPDRTGCSTYGGTQVVRTFAW